MTKTILITGSSRGIGASIARSAKASGYRVFLHGKEQSAVLKDLSEKLKSEYLVFDICNQIDVKRQTEKIRRLDVLVNCAGINVSKAFDELTSEDWRSVYDANVFGLVNVTRGLIAQLTESPGLGKIINVGSVKGTYSAVGRVAYASSKAAVASITTGLAKELAPKILVNSVAPGFTRTEMTENTWSPRIKSQVDNVLLKRMAEPEEIAKLVMFLAGEDNTYITGQTILIDGGFSIKND